MSTETSCACRRLDAEGRFELRRVDGRLSEIVVTGGDVDIRLDGAEDAAKTF